MPVNFQIPNQSGYLPQMPPAPDQTDTSTQQTQQPDMTPQEFQQMLMRAFAQRINAQPPTPPPQPDIGYLHGMFMRHLSGPVQELMIKRMMDQQPGAQEYEKQAAQYGAGQKQLGDIQQAMSSLGRNETSGNRMEMYRYLPGQVSYNDPERGNVTLQVWKDRLTGQIMDENRQPINLGPLTSAIHFQNYAGPQGENIQAPTVPMPQAGQQMVPQPAQRPSSTGIGHTPAPTVGSGVQGGQAQNVAPTGAAGKSTAHFNAQSAERVAGQSAFAAGLNELIGYQKRAHTAQTDTFGQVGVSPSGIPAAVGQMAADIASQHGYTQPFLQGSPLQAVTDYNVNMRPMLFNYVKQQTGVQFGMKEFAMYASQFPTSLDDVDTAIEKLGGLVRSVRQRYIAETQQFHGIEPDARFTAFVGKQMPRETLKQLPPNERLRFIVGGGQVTE